VSVFFENIFFITGILPTRYSSATPSYKRLSLPTDADNPSLKMNFFFFLGRRVVFENFSFS